MLFCQIAFFRHKNQRTNSKILCAYVLLSNCFLDIRTKEQVKHLVYLCSSVKLLFLDIRTKEQVKHLMCLCSSVKLLF